MLTATTAYLGLGANLGDPVQQLIDARSALYALEGSLTGKCSGFYLSSPVGYDAQPNFVNCVVELVTQSSAIKLLDAMQAIETRLGRQRVVGNQNAPRMIDIDLLLFGDETIANERLRVPHPRMLQRAFVLEPLSEFELNFEVLGAYRTGSSKTQFGGQTVHRLSIA